jgi:hypothetical protein
MRALKAPADETWREQTRYKTASVDRPARSQHRLFALTVKGAWPEP